jgi:hypothetical protein
VSGSACIVDCKTVGLRAGSRYRGCSVIEHPNPNRKNPLMVLNVALIVLSVLLALDCLFVAALVVADASPRVRKWFATRPARQPTAARKPF